MKRILKFGWMLSAVLSLGLMAVTCWADEDEGGQSDPVAIDASSLTGVTANGIDFSNLLEGAYDGTTRITINGKQFQAHSSTSPLTFTAPLDLVFRDAAMISAVRASTFETELGTLTTIDEIHIQPVPALGWYLVYGTLHVVGGTGVFTHSEGDLDLYGQIHVEGDISKLLSMIEGSLKFETLPS
jgi:hypothetical protein